jgi:site-specific DNA-adenine methylase
MKKNHFFIPYNGNKRSEVDNIYQSIKNKIDNIEFIIEPYCGTSAFSYYLSLQHPKKFKYILNDNNHYLIDLYKTANDDDKLNLLILDINNKMIDINKEKYLKIISDNSLSSYVIKHSIYSIRAGLFPTTKKIKTNFNFMKEVPILNFLKTEDITFSNIEAIDIYNQYKNNSNALIFLDPPYLHLNNDCYIKPNTNIYECLYKNDINNDKSFIILVLEDIWIIKLLFRDHIFITYDKTYQTSKKKTKHIIITNRDNSP